MQPNQPNQPPQPPRPPIPGRPTMGDVLPRSRYGAPHSPSSPESTLKLPPVQPVVRSASPSSVQSDPSHLLEAPHEPLLASSTSRDAALEPPKIDDERPPRRKHTKLKIWLGIIIFLVVAVATAIMGSKAWYQAQLQPVTTDAAAARIRITIELGSTPDQIGTLLEEKGLIRSAWAFGLYTSEKKVKNKLQAGTYNLKPSESLAEIVDHLVTGRTDEFSLTFLPGDSLENNRQVFIKAGYSAAEVDTALSKQYEHPALATKPASADLEGYIYGETYSFTGDATVEQILTRTFDELQEQIVKYDLVNAYKKHGLSLYEGITLASIIQREVSNEADEKQVAQVFYKRLKEGMPLGSDVTFIYAAKKLGVEATPDLDSPYNTRVHKGLPPGPIATPGLSALIAVATPASGDYNYFLAGDDGKTYFAHTYEEHQANITNHCQKGCQ